MAAPLALICSHKKTVVGGHSGETIAVCHDGDFVVTSSWDGELRVWGDGMHSGPVRSAFSECTQRVRAYKTDTPTAVTALAAVADGYLVSGTNDGWCAIWTRHGHRDPLHPTHVVEVESKESEEDEKKDDDENDEMAPEQPIDPSTPVPAPTEDTDEEEINDEQRELRTAAKLKWQNEEEFRGPYMRVGGFFNATSDDGIKASIDDTTATSTATFATPATCTVREILPVYARPNNPDSNDSNARLAPPSEESKQAAPRYLAVATSPNAGGGLATGVFICDVSDGMRRVDFLQHPEGVVCALVDQSCDYGFDRIVTGCMDGRIRIWKALGFSEVEVEEMEPHPEKTEEETDETYRLNCDARQAEYKLSTRQKRQTQKFTLEKTFDYPHEGRAVSCLRWLGRHKQFPPPFRPPPPTEKEFDNDPPVEMTPEEPDPPSDWPGKDSTLYFLSAGTDGSVKMWERRIVLRDLQGQNVLPINGVEKESKIEDSSDASKQTVDFEWGEELSEPVISDAPASARIAKDVSLNLPSLFENTSVKSLQVFDEKIVAGLSDGRVVVWGHRVHDASCVPGWCLEKIHPAPLKKKSAITLLHGCGLNMLVGTGDGKVHIYA